MADTPLDFSHGAVVGARLGQAFKQLRLAGGYDHNWALDGSGLRGGVWA